MKGALKHYPQINPSHKLLVCPCSQILESLFYQHFFRCVTLNIIRGEMNPLPPPPQEPSLQDNTSISLIDIDKSRFIAEDIAFECVTVRDSVPSWALEEHYDRNNFLDISEQQSQSQYLEALVLEEIDDRGNKSCGELSTKLKISL